MKHQSPVMTTAIIAQRVAWERAKWITSVGHKAQLNLNELRSI
jgi:hypothetical protein